MDKVKARDPNRDEIIKLFDEADETDRKVEHSICFCKEPIPTTLNLCFPNLFVVIET